jgi:hypothetical protein
MEPSGLADARSVAFRRGLELEPGAAGNAHLGSETEQVVWLVALDPPEVERVAGGHMLRISPAATQPDAADELVDHAAHAPEAVDGIPAGGAADTADRCERGIGRTRHPDSPGVDQGR